MREGLKRSKLHCQRLLRLSAIALLWVSCQGPVQTPKPRAYPKVEYPSRDFLRFEEGYCDFTFERPVYTQVVKDTAFFNQEPNHPCWFNLHYPAFDCNVYCSYYPISKETPFEKLSADAFRLAMEHNRKATYIDEHEIRNPKGIGGFVFDLEGPVATPFQFFLSDSTTHFFRGALYFNTQVRPDSLAPVYAFVKQDIAHLINTFEWRD